MGEKMKKFKNLFIILIILYIFLQIIKNSEMVHSTIIFSYDIFINTVFPNLFPFLVLSSLLINYGFVEICFKLFNPLMKKMFKISGSCSFIFIMSLLTGFPSNAKYTRELYEDGKIDEIEATKILMFTHFSNPLFVIGTISMFINKKVAIIILLTHYIGNIIIGLIFRNSFISNTESSIKKIKRLSFGTCFSNGVKDSINTLLLIYGTMTSFLVITAIIQNIISLNSFDHAVMSGILEFTQGLKYTSMIDVEDKIKAILMAMFISFGGISVHMQILSIIGDTKIKYQPFLIARLIHASISGILVYLLI